jgi:hypothetical protein
MTVTRKPREDPVVEEIRAIRRKILKEAGGSTGAYLELLRKKGEAARARAEKTARARKTPKGKAA